MHSCALVQCRERGMINIFKLVSDDGHFRSERAECCDVVIAGAGPFGRDLSGAARFFRCINMAAIAKLSRCHRQHSAELTAAPYADGGAGRKCGNSSSAATSAVCFSTHDSSRSTTGTYVLARIAARNKPDLVATCFPQ